MQISLALLYLAHMFINKLKTKFNSFLKTEWFEYKCLTEFMKTWLQ